jgi:hypothetical protein
MKTSLVWACHTHTHTHTRISSAQHDYGWGFQFLSLPGRARNFSRALDRVVRRLGFIGFWKNPAERKTFTYYAPQSAVGLERIHVTANLIYQKRGGGGGKTVVAACTPQKDVGTKGKPRKYGERGLRKINIQLLEDEQRRLRNGTKWMRWAEMQWY